MSLCESSSPFFRISTSLSLSVFERMPAATATITSPKITPNVTLRPVLMSSFFSYCSCLYPSCCVSAATSLIKKFVGPVSRMLAIFMEYFHGRISFPVQPAARRHLAYPEPVDEFALHHVPCPEPFFNPVSNWFVHLPLPLQYCVSPFDMLSLSVKYL